MHPWTWHGSERMPSIDVATGEPSWSASIAPTRAEWSLLVAASAVALGLRLLRLDRSELWFDEAFAALVVMEPTRALLSELAGDTAPPLYFLLLRGWSLLLGADAWTLRLFSVLCGLLAVWATFVAACRLWGARAGLASAALMAVSPLHIHYSREVRPYALLIVFVLASLMALEAMSRSRPASVAAYCGATAAATWTHNYGLFLLVVLGLWVLIRRVPAATAARAAGVVVAAYLPWLPVLVTQTTSGATQWVERLWVGTPPALAPLLSLAGFCIGGHTPEYIRTGSDAVPVWLQTLAYAAFALLIGAALVRRPVDDARRIALVVGVLLAVPTALSFITPIFLVGRHDVIALPLFLLLAGRGVALVRGGTAVSAWLLLMALATTAVYRLHTLPIAQSSRRQAASLLQHAGPRDAVLATGFTRNGVEYLTRERGRTMAFHSFPPSLGAHRGWVDERELADAALLRSDADRLTRALQETLTGDRLLWILHSRDLPRANALLLQRLERSFQQVFCPGTAEDHGITCWRRR